MLFYQGGWPFGRLVTAMDGGCLKFGMKGKKCDSLFSMSLFVALVVCVLLGYGREQVLYIHRRSGIKGTRLELEERLGGLDWLS